MTSDASPFVLVGDPTAAACEGDLCLVPGLREPVPAPPVDARETADEVDGGTPSPQP